MRLSLDLVSTLLLQNPDAQVREALKADFLSTLVLIITRKSIRPVVKSCISSLTQFLTKSIFTLDDVAQIYVTLRSDLAFAPSIVLWQSWIAEIFTWMELHYICPVAGKSLVLIFNLLHADTVSADSKLTSTRVLNIGDLRTSLETALSLNADIFESVKNYVLAPMAKSDRRIFVALLRELNNSGTVRQNGNSDDDVTALLHLAALDVGKKASIVDEPSKCSIYLQQHGPSV